MYILLCVFGYEILNIYMYLIIRSKRMVGYFFFIIFFKCMLIYEYYNGIE